MLSGCSRKGEVDETGGIVQIRSACPSAAIPAGTGDITLFNPAGSSDSRAIDVVGVISNLTSTCSDAGEQLATQATFTVTATRTDTGAAREVVLPYFSVVVRGATSVIAKRVGQVRLNFAPGEARASVTASAASYVDKSAATLPPEIDKEIRRNRKPGDEDAATDPMARPDVRDAITRTSFELLVGFNLTAAQLQYNATR
ncbi:hypothetical protein LWE61_05750 [Sphingobium sufflavum]|uniref:hypothetical protein n=1 Tax=Sphingobium sufflavum TaxID=1129547 RepID=UPI001F3F78E0|nr:hypothetical protein [Sphingobium sufflavum]MCE7796064.1 hypothetical protein [Sphingobium sufflavum]